MVRVYAVSNATYGFYLDREIAESAYWAGRGAELLELEDKVKPQEFWYLARGVDPNTGEILRPRQFDAKQSRPIFDAVVMSPKSAAIMSLFDERVIEAHKESVRTLLPSIEANARVRIRSGEWNNTDASVPTKNIVTGVWRHEMNRLKDPLLHSHVAIINMTRDAESQTWKALQAVQIYRNQKALSEQFRHELAPRLERLGYGIRDTEHSFEIEGVSPQILERFSCRSKDRDSLKERYEEVYGEKPDARTLTELLRQYRENKPKEPQAVIHREQIARLTPHEHTALLRLRDEALERQSLHERVAPTPETETPKERRKLSLHDGVHSEPDLKHEVWNYGETVSYKSGYKVRL